LPLQFHNAHQYLAANRCHPGDSSRGSGQPQKIILPATDVDGDGKIGMTEAIYAFQKADGFD
jgi:hypothetical protein